jgi:SAM-dependent methyltransferase
MPNQAERIAEIDEGKFGDESVSSAGNQLEEEQDRQLEFEGYVETIRQFAPQGRWLDIGCGTGQLILTAKNSGTECDGIELTRERRVLATQRTVGRIYNQPLENLEIPHGQYAAVIMINVFSHLVSPSSTFQRIHDVLAPDGVLLLRTGEIGPGAMAKHSFFWNLGDHLHWLGDNTIERYACKHGFTVVSRSKQWSPDIIFSRDWMNISGRSTVRNKIKRVLTRTPGLFPVFRLAMLSVVNRRNPVFSSTIVLRRDTLPQETKDQG